MEPMRMEDAHFPRGVSGDCTKLLSKLRWAGLEDEAQELQRALRRIPAEQRGTVSAGPFSTD
jgi:hypothetical protein